MTATTNAMPSRPHRGAGFVPTRGDWGVVGFSAAYLLALALVPLGPGHLRDVTAVASFGMPAATILAQLRLARSASLDNRSRWAWACFAASAVSMAIAGSVWTLWLAAHGNQPQPGWLAWLEAAYIPPAIAGFAAFPRGPRRALTNRRVQLDAALLVAAGLTLAWHFSLRPMFTDATPPGLVDYFTSIGDWLAFVAASVAFLRSRSRVTRAAVSLLIAAHVTGVLADSFWSNWASTYRPGDLIDASWFVTWMLRWYAARYAWHAGRRGHVMDEDEAGVHYRSGIAPTALVAGAYILLLVVVLRGDGDVIEIAFVASLMAGLLIARQRMELAENQRLAKATLAQAGRVHALLSHTEDYIAVLDDTHAVVWANASFAGGLSATAGVALADLVHEDDRANVLRWLAGSTPGGGGLPVACRLQWPDRTASEVELRIEDRRDDALVRGYVLNGRDVSAERALEGRLRHTEKLVTLHNIAGRIAHAFNNLLAVIAGHAELLAAEVGDSPRALEDVASIRTATERGAGITRQLLGFSGRHVIQPVSLPVAETIEAIEPALRRTLPPQATIELSLGDLRDQVMFDRSQFEQVFVNLVANARDAMPDGGTIRVSLTREQTDAADPSGEPDGTVVMRVSDDGVGIPKEDLRHIFEPFFTTKAPGFGTGLGLAMVDTIVRRAGGRVSVESAVGRGTTVAVHLPSARPTTPERKPAATETTEPSGRGVVLLVDDEAGVRSLSRRVL
ncbi:MAG: hypothetical protein KGK07_16450, partial [Chloroflexota bacterium]|nr:hypothetical protein [Chloroflexota bacterium]